VLLAYILSTKTVQFGEGVFMIRIIEKWNDAELVYDDYGYHLRVFLGDQLRSIINVTAENDDEAIKIARRAIYLFLS
jgi:hypothetical protein